MVVKFLAAAGVLAAQVLVSSPSLAGDAALQISTAATHAGMAAEAAEPAMVRTYLQHAVNCLTGPAGEGYDSTLANPCKDQGFGAMQDAPMDQIPKLRAIVRNARAGLAASDPDQTRGAASGTQAALVKLRP